MDLFFVLTLWFSARRFETFLFACVTCVLFCPGHVGAGSNAAIAAAASRAIGATLEVSLHLFV